MVGAEGEVEEVAEEEEEGVASVGASGRAGARTEATTTEAAVGGGRKVGRGPGGAEAFGPCCSRWTVRREVF